MRKLYELKEKLIEELKDYSQNGKYSKEDIEIIKYMTSAVDHLCNIIDESDDYSMEGSYNSGRSYNTMRGSYARGGNRGGGRRGGGRGGANQYGSYARGGYSRAAEDVKMQLQDIMEDAPNDQIKMEIQRVINNMDNM